MQIDHKITLVRREHRIHRLGRGDSHDDDTDTVSEGWQTSAKDAAAAQDSSSQANSESAEGSTAAGMGNAEGGSASSDDSTASSSSNSEDNLNTNSAVDSSTAGGENDQASSGWASDATGAAADSAQASSDSSDGSAATDGGDQGNAAGQASDSTDDSTSAVDKDDSAAASTDQVEQGLQTSASTDDSVAASAGNGQDGSASTSADDSEASSGAADGSTAAVHDSQATDPAQEQPKVDADGNVVSPTPAPSSGGNIGSEAPNPTAPDCPAADMCVSQGEASPPSWLPKCWACHQAYRNAYCQTLALEATPEYRNECTLDEQLRDKYCNKLGELWPEHPKGYDTSQGEVINNCFFPQSEYKTTVCSTPFTKFLPDCAADDELTEGYCKEFADEPDELEKKAHMSCIKHQSYVKEWCNHKSKQLKFEAVCASNVAVGSMYCKGFAKKQFVSEPMKTKCIDHTEYVQEFCDILASEATRPEMAAGYCATDNRTKLSYCEDLGAIEVDQDECWHVPEYVEAYCHKKKWADAAGKCAQVQVQDSSSSGDSDASNGDTPAADSPTPSDTTPSMLLQHKAELAAKRAKSRRQIWNHVQAVWTNAGKPGKDQYSFQDTLPPTL